VKVLSRLSSIVCYCSNLQPTPAYRSIAAATAAAACSFSVQILIFVLKTAAVFLLYSSFFLTVLGYAVSAVVLLVLSSLSLQQSLCL
jgi:hypothetical protein